jgi:hypothetical protein
MTTMNMFCESDFLVGFPAALDLAFGVRFSETVTVYSNPSGVRPTKAQLAAIVGSIGENTTVRYALGAPPEPQLSTDAFFVTSTGAIVSALCGWQVVGLDFVRQTELAENCFFPDLNAVARAKVTIARYSDLRMQPSFEHWLLAAVELAQGNIFAAPDYYLATALYEELKV